MTNEHVTIREFDMYCKQDAAWKDQLDRRFDKFDKKLDSFVSDGESVRSRLTTLEAYNQNSKSQTAKISAGVSTLITAIVAGLVSAFGK